MWRIRLARQSGAKNGVFEMKNFRFYHLRIVNLPLINSIVYYLYLITSSNFVKVIESMSETRDTFFDANVAPIFIIGSAVFSIFWGTVNALLVSTSLTPLIQVLG